MRVRVSPVALVPYKDKQKQGEYQRAWMRKRRAHYLQGEKCKYCNSKENLQIHHVNPDVKESHRIWSWAKKRLEAELAKCIVLCQRCHNEIHNPPEHGSRTRYEAHGCRCIACCSKHTTHLKYMSERDKRKRRQRQLALGRNHETT